MTYTIKKDFRPIGLYQNQESLPNGMTVIGLITRDGWDSGALIKVEKTGIFIQMNANYSRSLDQNEVQHALNQGE